MGFRPFRVNWVMGDGMDEARLAARSQGLKESLRAAADTHMTQTALRPARATLRRLAQSARRLISRG